MQHMQKQALYAEYAKCAKYAKCAEYARCAEYAKCAEYARCAEFAKPVKAVNAWVCGAFGNIWCQEIIFVLINNYIKMHYHEIIGEEQNRRYVNL